MEIWQHAVVTLAALAAGTLVWRRVFGVVAPRTPTGGCAGCPSARGACGTTSPTRKVVYFTGPSDPAAPS